MHGKEKVIAPVLEKQLGVKCFTINDFDTDVFGTFTGEIERKNNPVITAKAKCLAAMKVANCDLAMASEGSFGNHPAIYFATANEETLLLLDIKNNLEIWARKLSTDTNFYGCEIKSINEIDAIAELVKFPSHALIVRKSREEFTHITKGITSRSILETQCLTLIKKYGSAFLETDMRAMYNPSRMAVIEKVTYKLVEKIKSLCPKCNCSGFGITNALGGLPCSSCNYPTHSVISHIYTCQKCNYTLEKKYPHNKTSEDPMYCGKCNP
jgi:uncharacterized protein YqkB